MFSSQIAIGMTKGSVTVAGDRDLLNETIRLSQSEEENPGLLGSEEFASFTTDLDREWLMMVDYTSPEMIAFSTEQVFGMISSMLLDYTDGEELASPGGDWYEKYFGSILGVGYLKPDVYYTNSIWYTID